MKPLQPVSIFTCGAHETTGLWFRSTEFRAKEELLTVYEFQELDLVSHFSDFHTIRHVSHLNINQCKVNLNL